MDIVIGCIVVVCLLISLFMLINDFGDNLDKLLNQIDRESQARRKNYQQIEYLYLEKMKENNDERI